METSAGHTPSPGRRAAPQATVARQGRRQATRKGWLYYTRRFADRMGHRIE
jgi:hypothetical protein